ncbi:vegetative cell wall protein gp1-like [Miscanthus floridulus]|uniref:vegetative cell wall protein gp1-like n=1 Tax=Miscanthus floridulus TaxID=154761 RepID=UPI0034580A12
MPPSTSLPSRRRRAPPHAPSSLSTPSCSPRPPPSSSLPTRRRPHTLHPKPSAAPLPPHSAAPSLPTPPASAVDLHPARPVCHSHRLAHAPVPAAKPSASTIPPACPQRVPAPPRCPPAGSPLLDATPTTSWAASTARPPLRRQLFYGDPGD